MKNNMAILQPVSEDAVSIVFSADDGYVPYLSVVLQSIVENSNESRIYDVVVLHTSITREHQAVIINMVCDHKNFSIRFVDVSPFVSGKNFFVGGKKYFSVESYYRLVIPEVFQAYSKVIYMDCDMVVTTDIGRLYDTDLDGYMLASVPDYCLYGQYCAGWPIKQYWDNQLKLSCPEEYFCAGMVIFNISEWRKQYNIEQIIDLALSREWQKHDQDILNWVCAQKTKMLDLSWDIVRDYGDTKYLSAEYQYRVAEAEKNPYIVHYTSDRKPWNSAYVPHYEHFWKYAVNTPFSTDILRKMNGLGPYRSHVIKTFYGGECNRLYSSDDIYVYYKDILIGKESDGDLRWHKAGINQNNLHLEGSVALIHITENDELQIYAVVNEKYYLCDQMGLDVNEYRGKPQKLTYAKVAFSCTIPIDEKVECMPIEIECRINGYPTKKKKISIGRFFPVDKGYSLHYYAKNGHILYFNKNKLVLQKCGRKGRLIRELKFIKELAKSKSVGSKKAIIVRLLLPILKFFQLGRDIWLISDRTNKADDNGEALFEFLQSKKDKRHKYYYVLSPTSADYTRMKKIGPVVSPQSKKYKWLYLLCRHNISAQADDINIFPFQEQTGPYRDIIAQHDFIFLQHGIIKEDMSATYNRFNNNISLFVTAANPEYKSICENPRYGFGEDITKLTGCPRHDYLYHSEKKIITIMPTWRRYLFQHSEIPGVWEPRKEFIHSEYFSFYNGLINHSRLLKVAQAKGYTIRFMPHPNVQGALHLFAHNDTVQFLGLDSRYRNVFADSALVITDRSSAVMDFAYLRKPIIYCLFDDDTFMTGEHVYVKGYFDYERDGFGEVEYDLESTVDRIIEYMENGCQLKDKYRKRIDKFFAFNDHNNCQRVYEKIMELDKQE